MATFAEFQAHLLKLHAAGEHAIAELAELFEVSRPTVYRVLDRASITGSQRMRRDRRNHVLSTPV